MKYFIITGEKSGDMHAANLCKALYDLDKNAEICGWGGENLQASGVKILKNYNELAFMGFWEVIKNLKKILGFLSLVKKQIAVFKPDVIIFVDYAGFNLRVAKWAKNSKCKTAFYIAPKAWAWQKSRVFSIKKYIDELLVIFPFEKSFFEQYGINTTFVGNPLFDEIKNFKQNINFKAEYDFDNRPIIALLPGSRKQEVSNMLALMLEIHEEYNNYRFVVCGVSSLSSDCYELVKDKISVIYDKTYDVLSIAKAAIVTSGTATLETALFEVPQVVVYKTSNFSYQIAKRLIDIKYISLVNLVSEKEVVKELIQGEYNLATLKDSLNNILENNNYKINQLNDYKALKENLGGTGASLKAANQIFKLALKQ
jgi:lipid-A-disaccharide synthase